MEPSSRKTGQVASAPIWLLILSMGCTAVGLTIISPSLKSVAEEFDADSALAQFLLSGYFIAIASSQLIYGPISDRYGRRKPLLFGMGIYAIGGLIGVYATSITTLIYARILQGIGAAATVSIVRAIINDSYDRTKGASVFATISAVMVIAPIFSFICGGLIDEMIGWKGTMVIIALAGGISLVSNYFFLNETNLNPMGTIVPRLLISEYFELFSNRLFIAFVFASACSVGIFLCMIGFVPYEYSRLGLSPGEIGVWFASTPVGYMFGNFITRWMAKKLGLESMTFIGSTICFLSTVLLFLMTIGELLNPFLISFTGMVMGFSAGLVIPNATMGAIASAGRLAGSASGFTGAMQMGFGVIGGSIIAAVGGYELFHLGLLIIILMAVLGVAASLMTKRIARSKTARS